jgi:3'(2'), 5'-bisphosphate nucleotidase
MDSHNYLAIAIKATEEACLQIMNVYNSADFQVEAKGDHSPLTLADKKSHETIVQFLKATQLPILSEEGKNIPFEERKNWTRFWLVDPLDGTKEFIKRNGEFTVNIALIENNKPVLGVVAVPVTGHIFYGAKEYGAFLKQGNTMTTLESSSTIDLNKTGIRVVASRSHLNEETAQFIQSLHQPVLVSKGSSLKFLMLAIGEADVYPRFAPTMEWDTAAAHAIVNQLGIKVLQQNSTEELGYNKENLLNPSFICY